MSRFEIRPISAAQARPLRHSVLRPTQAAETLIFPGDDDGDSLHVGAFVNDELAGIASVARESLPTEPAAQAWRLRGMATLPQVRRQGVGAALIDACVRHVATHGGNVLWCHGRTSAMEFYHALGFREQGEEFENPISGPHHVMRRNILPRERGTNV